MLDLRKHRQYCQCTQVPGKEDFSLKCATESDSTYWIIRIVEITAVH